MIKRKIWIIDFGSQYTQLITRKIRELGYSSEIITIKEGKKRFENSLPEALILSGGPHSIFEDKEDYSILFEKEVPTLGICYGMQLMGHFFGGKVEKGEIGEYGFTEVLKVDSTINSPEKINAWMSHSDHIVTMPNDFEMIFKSQNDLIAGMKHKSRPYVGLQFHPEVEHTENGKDVLEYFCRDVAKLEQDWNASSMLEEAQELVKEVQDKKVLCAFSGGVDSLVAATLSEKVLGENLYCFFVDNGLLRPQDYSHIETLKKETSLNIEVIDSSELFLGKLKGTDEPEAKRKIIGNTFIEVFEEKVHEFESKHGIKFDYLLQGTLYPDVIESSSPHEDGGKSVTIKSHHNVGGLPERMKLKLLEPLRLLFKDEVRQIGKELGLNSRWVHRHPFPGPGIGVRILGEVTPERVKKVQESDAILMDTLHSQNFYDKTWQAFTVLLPVKTVGVKGDGRAYEEVICIRMVGSSDGMTATWTEAPYELLASASSRITNEVSGVTRVVYDITSKPPGTIEWE